MYTCMLLFVYVINIHEHIYREKACVILCFPLLCFYYSSILRHYAQILRKHARFLVWLKQPGTHHINQIWKFAWPLSVFVVTSFMLPWNTFWLIIAIGSSNLEILSHKQCSKHLPRSLNQAWSWWSCIRSNHFRGRSKAFPTDFYGKHYWIFHAGTIEHVRHWGWFPIKIVQLKGHAAVDAQGASNWCAMALRITRWRRRSSLRTRCSCCFSRNRCTSMASCSGCSWPEMCEKVALPDAGENCGYATRPAWICETCFF